MGEWRKLHNEELHNLYSSPDIIRQIKSRPVRWAGHVARMGEERKLLVYISPSLRTAIMVLSDSYWLGTCGLYSTGSGQGSVAGCCACGDGPSGSCATELD
jgi:hypothetical protein